MRVPSLIASLLAGTLVALAARSHPHPGDLPLPYVAYGGASAGAPGQPRPQQRALSLLPLQPTRQIAFETDEGTWMSIDIAPDDRTIVFDLLGDLYLLDPEGGRARPLSQGMSFDSQPVFSPDGQWIAYVSDRSGADNLWVIRSDGGERRQVSLGDDDSVLVSPAWSPDGRSLFVSRYLASLDNYELWRYGLDGKETLVAAIKDPNAPRASGISSLGAVVAANGQSIYFSRRNGEDEADLGRWSIVRRDLATGVEKTLLPDATGPGGRAPNVPVFRPMLSHDGRWLAYATRFAGQTGLRLRDLTTGADRWLRYPIEHDQIQAQSWLDLLPRYAFTHDNRSLLLCVGGKIERLPLTGGAPKQIPFVAAVDIPLGPLTRVDIAEDRGLVRARLIQTPEQSPDGRWLAFSALGQVYVMRLDGRGAPRRLTTGAMPEFHPSWSPDGRQIVYASWTAREGGQIWVAPALGRGAPRQISQAAAFYTRPVFARDGKHILALRSSAAGRQRAVMEFGQIRDAELVAWSTTNGKERTVYSGTIGGKPHFGTDPGKVYIGTATGLTTVDLESGVAAPAASVLGPGWYFIDGAVPVDELRASPDGHWLLALVAQQLHLVEMPAPDKAIDLTDPGLRHRRITEIGADFFDWADGGSTITWALGSTFHRRRLADIELNTADAPNWRTEAPRPNRNTETFNAQVAVPRDEARGRLLLRGARIIPMVQDRVIENADVLIVDGRFAAVGSRGSFKVPRSVQVLDVSGKTIVPGFVDMHDHVADIRRDVLSVDSWGLRARLAYGVTTAFDPSTLSIDMFAYQDLIDAGLMTGSRLRSTGMAMFSFNRLTSLADARALLTRYRDFYRTRNVKQYLIGHRRARQWIATASHELGMSPTTEGYLSLKLDLTMITDGYAGIEHSMATPLYKDVIEFIARSGSSNDTTLQIRNGSVPAQDLFIAHDRPLEDVKFLRTRPNSAAVAIGQSRRWTDPSVPFWTRFGGDVARVQRAGGVIGMGAHGEVPGPGFHWEMEAHVLGGMAPLEAMRAGTLGSATAIGRGAELGSIEVGKIADLVILNSDPRDDIRRTRDIDRVMMNGRLYDANTLTEVWPRVRPLTPEPWFRSEAPELLPQLETNDVEQKRLQ